MLLGSTGVSCSHVVMTCFVGKALKLRVEDDCWLVVSQIFYHFPFFHILGISSSQLTNSYFSDWYVNWEYLRRMTQAAERR